MRAYPEGEHASEHECVVCWPYSCQCSAAEILAREDEDYDGPDVEDDRDGWHADRAADRYERDMTRGW